jgi:mRNA interferase RelE/StbE
MNEPGSGWQIVIQRRAEKVMLRLPKDLLQRIWSAIQDLAQDPRPVGCKKLVGYDNLYCVRVGEWRISYAIEDDMLIILILEVASREGAYHNFQAHRWAG